MVTLTKNKPDTHVFDLKDGQVAVITKWGCGYEGRVIQRYGNHLIVLGKPNGDGWDNIFGKPRESAKDCRVRILEDGETLVVQNNQ